MRAYMCERERERKKCSNIDKVLPVSTKFNSKTKETDREVRKQITNGDELCKADLKIVLK